MLKWALHQTIFSSINLFLSFKFLNFFKKYTFYLKVLVCLHFTGTNIAGTIYTNKRPYRPEKKNGKTCLCDKYFFLLHTRCCFSYELSIILLKIMLKLFDRMICKNIYFLHGPFIQFSI